MQDKLILHPEFSLIPEGNDVRIRNKHVNYLFGRMNEQDFIKLYNRNTAFTRKFFIYDKTLHEKFTYEQYLMLTQEITLRCMYYYNVNRLRVRLTVSDLKHPQTFAAVKYHMEEIFGEGGNEDNRIAAEFLKMNLYDYLAWAEGHERYINR